MLARLVYSSIILAASCIVPVYITIALCIIGICLFKNYVECLVIVLWYEIVFTPATHAFPVVWTLGLACFLFGIEYIRPLMRK
jgi:hypothetical protein